MNKSKGNMYKHISHTWNPIGGDCIHNCGYCSTNKFYYPALIKKYSGPPKLIESELKTNFGKGKTIFVAAQHDLFGRDISDEWIVKILEHCSRYDNKYLLQTKNPSRIVDFIGYPLKMDSLDNFTICTTIETNRWYPVHMGNTPYPEERIGAITGIGEYKFKTEITIEPIMNFDLKPFIALLKLTNVDRINIGADSGNNNLPEPSPEKLQELISALESFTTIHSKKNLHRLLK